MHALSSHAHSRERTRVSLIVSVHCCQPAAVVFWCATKPVQKISIYSDGFSFWTNAFGFLPAEEGKAHISFVLNGSASAGTVLTVADVYGGLTVSYISGNQTLLCWLVSSHGICNDDCNCAKEGASHDGGPSPDYSACNHKADCDDCGPAAYLVRECEM